MNPKYKNTPIFERRSTEWTKDNIQKHIDKIFGSISVLDGWTYSGSEWIEVAKSKRKEDLKKSVFSIIRTKIKDPNGKEYDYSIQVPDLYNNQFFFIGGFLRVPIFQLYDLPIIYRKVAKNNSIILKLRTNSISISVDLNRKDEIPHVNLFNRDIPLHILISAMHTNEELNIFIENHPSSNEILSKIYNLVREEWAKNRSEDDTINLVGEFFINHPAEKYRKGKAALFSLKAAYEVDHFSKKYFNTNSLLFEILHAIWEGPRSDTDLKYKRIRFSEYVLAPLIHKAYEMLITLQKHQKDKFQIPQNILLEHCNTTEGKNIKTPVANIIHYNNPINPVGEIASFLQCTLVGPGGFKKDNVPPHLRNIDESQFGLLCPADTPDREGCGVIHNMVPTIDITPDGLFGTINEDVITSFPITLVPFLKNDDPTRLQMASNQIKQSIMLKEAEPAWIRSGNEVLYMDETTFQHKAKNDGIVIYLDQSFMIVVYDTIEPKKVDIFQIGYRSLYLNTTDCIVPKFNVGDRFKKNDILAESKFIKDNNLAMGHNLLTSVMIWKGFNYEDGIVISESACNKLISLHSVDLTFNVESGQVLLSLEDKDYKPLCHIGQEIKKGEKFAKIKNLDWEGGFDNINEEPIEQKSPLDCKILSLEIFPNAWNKQIEEFNVKIRNVINEQLTRYNLIINALSPYMEKEEIDKFMTMHNLSSLNCDQKHIGKFYNKGQKIGGIMFRMKGLYEEKIGCGDKIANRHGNKGVISRIVRDEQMPILEDGRRVEIIINPLGIISRMNVGQLSELQLGEAIYQLKQKMLGCATPKSARTMLKKFITFIDNTENNWARDVIMNDFDKNLEKYNIEKAVEKIYTIMPPFESATPSQIEKAMKFVGATDKMKLIDPLTDNSISNIDPDTYEKIEAIDVINPIACGYMYFHKLVHRSSDKVAARSIGPYNKKTSQPMGGKSNLGGHRLGEMEVWALLAHNAKTFLKDLLTVHSDSIGLKNEVLAEMLQNPELKDESDMDIRPQSLRIMEAYLNIIGLSMEMEDGRVPDILAQNSLTKTDEQAHEIRKQYNQTTLGEIINDK